MNAEKEYVTYWYESYDGEVEPIEIEASAPPPEVLTMPNAYGVVESFMRVDDEFDDIGTIFDE